MVLTIILLAVPVVIGSLPVYAGAGEKNGPAGVILRWVSGQLILWAGFQLLCVPFVLTEKRFGNVVLLFNVYTAALFLLTAAVVIVRGRKGKIARGSLENTAGGKDRATAVLWLGIFVLLALQLFLACILAYEEGDDAYYIAVANVTKQSDTMYRVLPYTGGSTEVDMRHGMAPFPVWVAYLSKLSGIPVVIVAHIVLPLTLIAMSCGIYYLIGRRMFVNDGRKQALFLLTAEILILFGGYSLYTPENFLLVRTAQGKAVLANIVLPFLLWLFLTILDKVQASEKIGICLWLLTASTMTAGCLCSTQAAFLVGMLAGIVGLCTAVCYRRWRFLLPLLGCCIVPAGTILLYYLL